MSASRRLRPRDIALPEVIGNFEQLLADSPSEAKWGEFLRENLFLVESRYVQIIERLNVILARSREADFALVDSHGFLDLFEIKKPETHLLAASQDRGNHYWHADAVKAIVQAEKYMYNAMQNALGLAANIQRELGLTVKVVRPRAVVIMGHSDLIRSVLKKGDALAHDVEQIRRASERAASLTRQLLAFSRRQFLQPQVIDVSTLVGNLATMLRRLIAEDIQLDLRLDPEAGRVSADPGQLEQVIVNLAVNARDAMPAGGRLTVDAANVTLDAQYAGMHPEAKAGPYVSLEVTDTGTGIPPEIRARIFEPFFTTKDIGKGTGIGLATVHTVVKSHGGFMQLDSAMGRGTTFRVFLPRMEQARVVSDEPERVDPPVSGRQVGTL